MQGCESLMKIPAASSVFPLPPCAYCLGQGRREQVENAQCTVERKHVSVNLSHDPLVPYEKVYSRFLVVSEDRRQLLWCSKRKGTQSSSSSTVVVSHVAPRLSEKTIEETPHDMGAHAASSTVRTSAEDLHALPASLSSTTEALARVEDVHEMEETCKHCRSNAMTQQEEIVFSSTVSSSLPFSPDAGDTSLGVSDTIQAREREERPDALSSSSHLHHDYHEIPAEIAAVKEEEQGCVAGSSEMEVTEGEHTNEMDHTQETPRHRLSSSALPRSTKGEEERSEDSTVTSLSPQDAVWTLPATNVETEEKEEKEKKERVAVSDAVVVVPLWIFESFQHRSSERNAEEGEDTHGETIPAPLPRKDANAEEEVHATTVPQHAASESDAARERNTHASWDRIQRVLLNPSLTTTALCRVAPVRSTDPALFAFIESQRCQAHQCPDVDITSEKSSSYSDIASTTLSSSPSLFSLEGCQKGYAVEVVIITEQGSVIRLFLNNLSCPLCDEDLASCISHFCAYSMERSRGTTRPANLYGKPDGGGVPVPMLLARLPEWVCRLSLWDSRVVTHSTPLTILPHPSQERSWVGGRRSGKTTLSFQETSALHTAGTAFLRSNERRHVSSDTREGSAVSSSWSVRTGGHLRFTRRCLSSSAGDLFPSKDHHATGMGVGGDGGTSLLLLAIYLKEEGLTEVLALDDPYPVVPLDVSMSHWHQSRAPATLEEEIKGDTATGTMVLSSSRVPSFPSTSLRASRGPMRATTSTQGAAPSSVSPFFASLCSARRGEKWIAERTTTNSTRDTMAMEKTSACNARRNSSTTRSSFSLPSWSPFLASSPSGPSSTRYAASRVLFRCAGRLSSILWDPLLLHIIVVYTIASPLRHSPHLRIAQDSLSSPLAEPSSCTPLFSSTSASASRGSSSTVVVEVFSWCEERFIQSSRPSSPLFTPELCWSTLKYGRPSPNCALIVPGGGSSGGGAEGKGSTSSLWIGTDRGHVVVLPLFSASSEKRSLPQHRITRHGRSHSSVPLPSSSGAVAADGRVLELPSLFLGSEDDAARSVCRIPPLSSLCPPPPVIPFSASGAQKGVAHHSTGQREGTPPSSSLSSMTPDFPTSSIPYWNATNSSTHPPVTELFLMAGGMEVWGYRQGEAHFLVWDASQGVPLRRIVLPARGGYRKGKARKATEKETSSDAPSQVFPLSGVGRGGLSSTVVTIEYLWFLGSPPGSPQRSVIASLRGSRQGKEKEQKRCMESTREGEASEEPPLPAIQQGGAREDDEEEGKEWVGHLGNEVGFLSLLPAVQVHHWVSSSAQRPLWMEQTTLRHYAQESSVVQMAISNCVSALYAPIQESMHKRRAETKQEEWNDGDRPLAPISSFSLPTTSRTSHHNSPIPLATITEDVGTTEGVAPTAKTARIPPAIDSLCKNEEEHGPPLENKDGPAPPIQAPLAQQNRHTHVAPPHLTSVGHHHKEDLQIEERREEEDATVSEKMTAIQRRVEEYEWTREKLLSSFSYSSPSTWPSAMQPSSLPTFASFSLLELVEVLLEHQTGEATRKYTVPDLTHSPTSTHISPSLVPDRPPQQEMGCTSETEALRQVVTTDPSSSAMMHPAKVSDGTATPLPWPSFLARVQALWMSWTSHSSSVPCNSNTSSLVGAPRTPRSESKENVTDTDILPGCREGVQKDALQDGAPYAGEKSLALPAPQTLEEVWRWLQYLVGCVLQRRCIAKTAESTRQHTTIDNGAGSHDCMVESVEVLSPYSLDWSSTSLATRTNRYSRKERRSTNEKKRTSKEEEYFLYPYHLHYQYQAGRGGTEGQQKGKRKHKKPKEQQLLLGTVTDFLYADDESDRSKEEDKKEGTPVSPRSPRSPNTPHRRRRGSPSPPEKRRCWSPNATACLEVMLEEAQRGRAAAEEEVQSLSHQLCITRDLLSAHEEQVCVLKKSLGAAQQAAEKNAVAASTLMALEGRLAAVNSECLAAKSALLAAHEREEEQRREIVQLRQQMEEYQQVEQQYQKKEGLAKHVMEEFRSTENVIMKELEELLYTGQYLQTQLEENEEEDGRSLSLCPPEEQITKKRCIPESFFTLFEAVMDFYGFVVDRLKEQKQYFRDVKSNLISLPCPSPSICYE